MSVKEGLIKEREVINQEISNLNNKLDKVRATYETTRTIVGLKVELLNSALCNITEAISEYDCTEVDPDADNKEPIFTDLSNLKPIDGLEEAVKGAKQLLKDSDELRDTMPMTPAMTSRSLEVDALVRGGMAYQALINLHKKK